MPADGDKKCTMCAVSTYGPMIGAGSYALLSLHVLNPSLRYGFIDKGTATNMFLFGSVVGTGTYILSRPHLKTATLEQRLGYAAFGSISFTFGSVLLWAVLRNMLPDNELIASAAGLGSGYLWALTAKKYVNHIDSQIEKQIEETVEKPRTNWLSFFLGR